jgi:hypothetical protein
VSNVITNVLPKIIAAGGVALRQNAVFSRLVNHDLQVLVSRKGNVINVPIPSAIPARAVTPGVAFASNVDSSPTNAPVTLDQWYEAPLNLSDSDLAAADEQFMMLQGTEAIKSLANNVDLYILGKHTGFFGYSGAPGTTPFNGSLTVAASAKMVLSRQLAAIDNRRMVIDPLAEAMAVIVPEILRFDGRGDQGGIINGQIGTKLGFDWYVNQNINSYTPGAGWVTGFAVSTTTGVAGASTLHILNATASGAIKIGDLFTMTTDTKQYVVTAAATASATVGIDITVYPALASSYAVGATLAVVATAYTINVAFHRDAWAFASRPLQAAFQAGNIFQLPTDPVTGIALRLELSRQYKQETLSYDILYGANVIRPELGSKVFG